MVFPLRMTRLLLSQSVFYAIAKRPECLTADSRKTSTLSVALTMAPSPLVAAFSGFLRRWEKITTPENIQRSSGKAAQATCSPCQWVSTSQRNKSGRYHQHLTGKESSGTHSIQILYEACDVNFFPTRLCLHYFAKHQHACKYESNHYCCVDAFSWGLNSS